MSSSSSEEDGDAEWKAAIDSVTSQVTNGFGVTPPSTGETSQAAKDEGDLEKKPQSRPLKLYQVKAQKLLDDILEKNLVIVRDSTISSDRSPRESDDDTGVRLFRNAPPGIIFEPIDEFTHPRKRLKILPGEDIDEKSKKFKRQIRSAAVEGDHVMAAARHACQTSLDRFQAKAMAAKAKSEKEEKRIEELKRVRGEKWLPSIARKKNIEQHLSRRGKIVGVVL
ncbi:hypothetical protein H6P81_020681 [Aristolochia fimbriata]|uniref:Uncharacterized protein n=1 Tax=Aristolochia fimbriata TaxID=158543 RepID=A0AAV7DYB4_ARIFI|nr:hypothetical protein H6P81_020681 [Aristolochia fimbriata]